MLKNAVLWIGQGHGWYTQELTEALISYPRPEEDKCRQDSSTV